jgi:hypothetical protein
MLTHFFPQAFSKAAPDHNNKLFPFKSFYAMTLGFCPPKILKCFSSHILADIRNTFTLNTKFLVVGLANWLESQSWAFSRLLVLVISQTTI